MNSYRLLLAMLLGCMSLNAYAEIYKCTNSQGKTQYGDKPCGGKETVFTPRAAPPSAQTGLTAEERRVKTNKLLNAFQSERQDKQRAATEASNAKEERRRECVNARDYYRSIVEAGRVYDLDEQGKRVTISDSARGKETARAKAAVQHWCGK